MTTQTVFVSGGTGSIGSAIVSRFANDGYNVHFSYDSSEKEAASLCEQLGVSRHHVNMLGDWDPPNLSPDILVNNAGVNLSGHAFVDTTDAEIQHTLEVNLFGAVRLTRAYIPHMCSTGFGRVININSLYGLVVPALRLSYGVSKFALRAFTIGLSQEVASFGVTVNDVCPGPVNSLMLRRMGADAVQQGRYCDVASYLSIVGAEVPIGRLIEADEVAGVAAFLATRAASAITGQAIRVDGGLTP